MNKTHTPTGGPLMVWSVEKMSTLLFQLTLLRIDHINEIK